MTSLEVAQQMILWLGHINCQDLYIETDLWEIVGVFDILVRQNL